MWPRTMMFSASWPISPSKLAVDAVPLEQVGEGLGVGQVVDGGDLLDLGLGHGAQDVAADAAEAVDSEFWHSDDEVYERYADAERQTI